MGSWKQALMARGVDCSWIQLVSHALSLSFKRKREIEHVRMWEKKNILLYKGCSLSVCSAKGKRSSPFSITKGFLILVFPHASPLKPPVPSAVWEIQRVHFFHRSPHTHVEILLPRQHFSPLIMMSVRHKLRAKIQINKTSHTCSFHIFIPLNTSMCAVYTGTCLSLGVIKPHAPKKKCTDQQQLYDLQQPLWCSLFLNTK